MALMLRLLFLADSVLKSRGADNVEEHADIEPRWLMCHEHGTCSCGKQRM